MTRAILTDIEGTTSSISFVKEVLFPYAERALPGWLAEHKDRPAVRERIEAVAAEAGCNSDDLATVTRQLRDWIRQDVKATPLKDLQGMVWLDGYENEDYKAHVYEDALQKLHDWHGAGIPLYVYSSGSINAQKLFFQYSTYGDLRRLFLGYFDTTTGPKRDAGSYRKIATAIGIDAADILFLSDIPAEIDAAREAGMETCLLIRDADSALDPDDFDYPTARSFVDVEVKLQK